MDALTTADGRLATPMIQLERWDSLWPDAQKLMLAHKIEAGQDDPRRALAPDHDSIRKMERAEALLVLGARSGLRLVGYSIWYIMPSLETAGLVVGLQGPWYVDPSWRTSGVGLRLWQESQLELRRRSVRLVQAHAPGRGAGAELGLFFARQGGKLVETVYEMWLDEPAQAGD